MRMIITMYAVAAVMAAAPGLAAAQDNPMTFFLTSAGPGNGGDLGGLAGADAHCQMLGGRRPTWRL